jgi:hypothetical protein
MSQVYTKADGIHCVLTGLPPQVHYTVNLSCLTVVIELISLIIRLSIGSWCVQSVPGEACHRFQGSTCQLPN